MATGNTRILCRFVIYGACVHDCLAVCYRFSQKVTSDLIRENVLSKDVPLDKYISNEDTVMWLMEHRSEVLPAWGEQAANEAIRPWYFATMAANDIGM